MFDILHLDIVNEVFNCAKILSSSECGHWGGWYAYHDLEIRTLSDSRRCDLSQAIANKEPPILLLIRSGKVDYFRQYIRANLASLNAGYPPSGWTSLHHLAALGSETLPVHARMTEKLLRAGADVICRTVLGWTPLHFIAMQGQAQAIELAKVLIAHGLDLTAVDKDGNGWKYFWQHGKEIYDLLENASKR